MQADEKVMEYSVRDVVHSTIPRVHVWGWAGPFHLVGERGKDFGFIRMACIYLFISKGWDRCLLWIDEIPS